MTLDNGPWLVTIWLHKWPGANRVKIVFSDIHVDKLKADLTKALNKPQRTNVLRKYIPPNMVHFEIKKKK